MNKINVDSSEIAKFSHSAALWWDINGHLKALHDINPLRLAYINQRTPLAHQAVIDVGCGGGILTESMAKLGAKVTGIDMSPEALQVANLRQLEQSTNIEYILSTAEDLAVLRPASFDIVTCLEMLEHVPNPASVIKACATLVKPGGHVFFSTLNRNLKSYLFAIIGAEYILKLLPQQTHEYAKFIQPSELVEWAQDSGLKALEMKGLTYQPWFKQYKLVDDVSVNYLVHLQKIG